MADKNKKHKKYLLLMNFGLEGWSIIDESDSLADTKESLKKTMLVTPDAEVLISENITGKKRTAKRG